MTISEPSQSGKTYLTTKILENVDKIINPPPKKLIYSYTCWQPLYDKIKENMKNSKDHSSLREYAFIDCKRKRIPQISKF